jgi:hypothetical protein
LTANGFSSCTPLPESTLYVLRDYWKHHRNPSWIFPRLGRSGKEGPSAAKPMAKASVQGALRRVLKQLNIKKCISNPCRKYFVQVKLSSILFEAIPYIDSAINPGFLNNGLKTTFQVVSILIGYG